MKTKIALASFLILSGSSVYGASVSVDLFTNTNSVTSTSTALNNTFQARFGVYTGGALTATSTATDIIAGGWAQAGFTNFASGPAAGYNGYFSSGSLIFTDAAGVANQQIWVWLTDGGDNNALFTSATFGTFKADAAIPNNTILSLQATNIASASFSIGAYDPLASNVEGGGSIVLNNAIPEPTVTLLGAIGVLGLLRRRRN